MQIHIALTTNMPALSRGWKPRIVELSLIIDFHIFGRSKIQRFYRRNVVKFNYMTVVLVNNNNNNNFFASEQQIARSLQQQKGMFGRI